MKEWSLVRKIILATFFAWVIPMMAIAETNPKIKYIRNEVPAFSIPPYVGERYEELIPATLDLADMAEMAIHGMAKATDPEYDHESYMWVHLSRKPPVMLHELTGASVCKPMECMPLMRIITGSDKYMEVDTSWMEVLLKQTGPDGLIYWPMIGRPWVKKFKQVSWTGKELTSGTTALPGTQYAFPHCGRYMGAMMLYYQRDHNPMWKQMIEAYINRLNNLAIDKGNYAFLYPPGGGAVELNYVPPKDPPTPVGLVSHTPMWNLQAMAQFYKLTGYEPAGKLANKLVKYMKDQGGWFDQEGRYLSADQDKHPPVSFTKRNLGKYGGHFHAHTYPLLAMLEYATATNDQELMQFVKKGYDFGKQSGSSLTGFFPENIEPDYPTAEACEVADMIAIATKLAEAGYDECWDDLDRWVRNQFVELQMTKSDWVTRWKQEPKPVEINETADRVAERNIGNFFGWSHFNDGASNMMHCCVGNAARSIYYAWQDIVTSREGQLKVNLLLNRASQWADIYSHIPYQGLVEVKLKQSFKSLQVRVPQWIESGSELVRCEVDGQPRKLEWTGRYVEVGPIEGGQKVAVSFPISERTVKERIGGVDYTLVIKGTTVVWVDPPGRINPLYERDQYRQNQTLWVKKSRFASQDTIHW